MFAVGHIALGYLTGKPLGRLMGAEVDLSLLLALSLLPDIDLIIPWITHRGPTHSLFFIALVAAMIAAYRPRQASPYVAALSTHSLIGDMVTDGGTQLLWPFSAELIQLRFFTVSASHAVYLEMALFLALLATMAVTRDLHKLIKPHKGNLMLVIPVSTILLPLAIEYPMRVPGPLVVPHLVLMGLLGLSLLQSLPPIMEARVA